MDLGFYVKDGACTFSATNAAVITALGRYIFVLSITSCSHEGPVWGVGMYLLLYFLITYNIILVSAVLRSDLIFFNLSFLFFIEV